MWEGFIIGFLLELGDSQQVLIKQGSVLYPMSRSGRKFVIEYLGNFYLRGRNIKAGLELSLGKN